MSHPGAPDPTGDGVDSDCGGYDGTDSDGDGLMDDEEASVGTDAGDPDTDGDGFVDGVESVECWDALDAASHPWTGAYPHGPPPAAPLVPGSVQVGDVPPNWTFTDQHGESVSLYDFYGNVVALEIGVEWGAPDHGLASSLEGLYGWYGGDGFVAVAVLEQGIAQGSDPVAARFATQNFLTLPVLEDPAETLFATNQPLSSSTPRCALFDRSLVLQCECGGSPFGCQSMVEPLMAEPPPPTGPCPSAP